MTHGSRPRRRILAITLLVLASSFLGAVPALAEPVSLLVERPGIGPFADDDHSVFEDDIVALWSAGIATGCEAHAYCPDVPITRGEMAAMLRRSAPDRFPAAESPFVDTGSSPFAADAAALAAAGVTNGCAPDLFCPDAPVTRQQMAAFIRRTFQDSVPHTRDPEPFDDVVGSVFASDIEWLAGTRITSGCAPNLFCPEEPVTRGQMAAFLRRALDLPSVQAPSTVVVDLSIPTGEGAEGWRALVAHFFHPRDVDLAVRVISCESLGDPDAKNPRSTASGLFQHLASQWPPRAEAAGYPGVSVFDPVANVAAAAWLVYEGGGWSHWNASRSCWS